MSQTAIQPSTVWRQTRSTWTGTARPGLTMIDSVLLEPSRVTDVNDKIAGLGDFNGDGNADMLWWDSRNGWLVVWHMLGTRLLSSVALNPERVADIDWTPVGVADVNGDGQPDVIWRHQRDGWVTVWLMNGRHLPGGIDFSPDRVGDINWRIVGPK